MPYRAKGPKGTRDTSKERSHQQENTFKSKAKFFWPFRERSLRAHSLSRKIQCAINTYYEVWFHFKMRQRCRNREANFYRPGPLRWSLSVGISRRSGNFFKPQKSIILKGFSTHNIFHIFRHALTFRPNKRDNTL